LNPKYDDTDQGGHNQDIDHVGDVFVDGQYDLLPVKFEHGEALLA
jgi:hypothetical protein